MNRSLFRTSRGRRVLCALFAMIVTVAGVQQAPADMIYGAANSGGSGPGGGPSTLYTINEVSGLATAVGAITVDGEAFYRVSGMDFHPETGELYATGFDAYGIHYLITIDTATGVGTRVGATGTDIGFNDESIYGENTSDLSFRASDNALFAFLWPDASGLATIDTDTGVASEVTDWTGFEDEGNGIAFVLTPESQEILYHAGRRLNILDQVTGDGTLGPVLSGALGGEGGPFEINAMDYDDATHTMFASLFIDAFGNYLAWIDLETGYVSIIGPTVAGLDAIAVMVPAPGAALLGLIGLAAIGFVRRRFA